MTAMEAKFARFTAGLYLKPGASYDLVKNVQSQLGISLPAQFIEFIMESNGAEGSIGSNSYLQLWPIQEIAALNEAYSVYKFAPGLLLFGSDGGGTAYAFDTRSEDMPIVDVPFIPLSLNEAKMRARNFIEFLENLSS